MIVVTRLNGPPFAVNPDLVQRIDSAPDTILTLVDGTKYIVQETMEEVIELVNEHRSRMIARSQEIQRDDARPQTGPTPVARGLRSAPALPEVPDDSDLEDALRLVRRERQPELALVRPSVEEDR